MSPHFLYVVTICFSDPEPELREWTNDQVSRSVEYGIYPYVILNINPFIICYFSKLIYSESLEMQNFISESPFKKLQRKTR